MKMSDIAFEKLLKTLQCQFLCCHPVSNIKWEDIPANLTWEQQELFIQNTCGHPLNKERPIKLEYQLNFLKRLIQFLEKTSDVEIHDDVYNEYCKVQQKLNESEEFVYKHYLIPKCSAQLSMREAKTFVGRGTTGLCTWQASLALAEFLLHHADIARGKNIFELGAGTGLCGMILAQCNAVKNVILTDGSRECIELMKENIKRNFHEAQEIKDGIFHRTENHIIAAKYMPWESVEEFPFNENKLPELVLAADVVYDNEIFDSLVHAVEFIFKIGPQDIKMLLAATVRNIETLEEFLEIVNKKFSVKEFAIVPERESYLQWDRSMVVRIFEITRK